MSGDPLSISDCTLDYAHQVWDGVDECEEVPWAWLSSCHEMVMKDFLSAGVSAVADRSAASQTSMTRHHLFLRPMDTTPW
jgi:hypothetical protein